MQDTPVIIITGPRQCGKTTLAQEIKQEDWQYISFDDLNQLKTATDDPTGFIRNLTANHVIIDEVQRAPELFLPIKQAVDEHRTPGRFLLTGSANALLLPQLSDALAGRLEIITLLPLAECEIQKTPSTFLTKIISGDLPRVKETRIRAKLIDKIIAGGFPESLARTSDTRRSAWHLQYLNTIVQKDIKEMSHFDNLEAMPKLIKLMCNQSGQLMQYAELAGRIGLSRQTMVRYTKLLEQLFIFEHLPAWHHNENKRIIKTPKIHITDTGLICAIQRINKKKLLAHPEKLGNLLESYVFCELKRLASWHEEPLYFYHYRDKDKVEVDMVLETLTGDVIGIEVKAAATLKDSDFQGLRRLQKAAGTSFLTGIVLYDGDHSGAHGDKIYSLPLAAIWE